MFARLVARPKSAPSGCPAVTAQRSSHDVVGRGQSAQRTIANQAMWTTPTRCVSWNFRRILLVSPNNAKQFEIPPPRLASPLRAPIHAKIRVGASDDLLEHEADRVADRVMRMPAPQVAAAVPQISRKCDACAEKEELQKKPAGPQGVARDPPAVVHDVFGSHGEPLDVATRAYFEPRFGHDFSNVRVHSDDRAAASARAVNAVAYTAGESIVFGEGQRQPGTWRGRHLLAHELAHVVQQRQGLGAGHLRRKATKDDEDRKAVAVKHHKKQQTLVRDFLANALKIKPDPAKSPLDADTLYHNTAELLDQGKTTLKVLSPTHYSTDANPAYFDDGVVHPQIG